MTPVIPDGEEQHVDIITREIDEYSLDDETRQYVLENLVPNGLLSKKQFGEKLFARLVTAYKDSNQKDADRQLIDPIYFAYFNLLAFNDRTLPSETLSEIIQRLNAYMLEDCSRYGSATPSDIARSTNDRLTALHGLSVNKADEAERERLELCEIYLSALNSDVTEGLDKARRPKVVEY